MQQSTHLDLVIDVLMLTGSILLQSGAEIHRVEDTMIRIAHSQGITNANVLAIPAAIFFSIDHTNISRMKRIVHTTHDMQKLSQVNQVSRSLVNGDIHLGEALKQLHHIKEQPLPYRQFETILAAIVAAPCFTLMFGGTILEALVTALVTIVAFPFSLVIERFVRIDFVATFAGAFVFSFLSLVFIKYSSWSLDSHMIQAGAVMPFVPGIAFTNAVRDLMTNHLNTGMTKIFQTLLSLLSLGAGTALAFFLVG